MSFKSLYSLSQIRAIEHQAIQKERIPEYELMERAGRAAFDVMRHYFPHAVRIAVVCGGGNNGGDGYVLARLAFQAGLQVQLYSLTDDVKGLNANSTPVSAQQAAQLCLDAGLSIEPFPDASLSSNDVIVDAILGIGARGKLREDIQKAIHVVNQTGCPVLSMDIPSGLEAEQGGILGEPIRASVTVTFIGIKQGMVTGHGPDYCGVIVCKDLDLSCVLKASACSARRKDFSAVNIPARSINSHKGNYGHVVVIGGDEGMGGAVCLAGIAALRTGAGSVSVVTRPEHVAACLARCPELMCHGLEMESLENISSIAAKASICVLGPGMGNTEWSRKCVEMVLKALPSMSLVVDAGAFNYLADFSRDMPVIFENAKLYPSISKRDEARRCRARGVYEEYMSTRGKSQQSTLLKDDGYNWILTPHPGEAGRLLGKSSEAVQQSRFESVRMLQKCFGGVTVLKGAGTIIDDGSAPVTVSAYSLPCMSTAGMGDVLSGVIAGLYAQGSSLFEAAEYGVLLHAHAAEKASLFYHYRSLLASDLFAFLPVG